MKKLDRIIFVNWYLFGSKQFDIKGDLLITGLNGSGKTAVLDAIQIVTMGGHGHHVQFNANAAEKSERNIRGYCLGQLNNEDSSGAFTVVRNDAVTHVALVFTDEVSGESSTIGISLSAKKSQPQHEVHGLYIAEGMKLSLDDYLETSQFGDIPLSWNKFKQELQRKARLQGLNPYIYGKQPEKYIEQLCLTLGAKGKQIDSNKFIHSFRKAVNLKEIDNISDFVKMFVLDEKSIDINRLDKSVGIYKEMLASAENVKAQIDIMDGIDNLFKKWQRCCKDKVSYDWVEKEYQFLIEDTKRVDIEDEQASILEKEALAKIALSDCKSAWVKANALMVDLKEKLDSDDKESQVKALKAEIKSLEQEMASIKTTLKSGLAMLESIAFLDRFKEFYTDSTDILVNQAKALLPEGEIEALAWPDKPSEVDAMVFSLKEIMEQAITDTANKFDELTVSYNASKIAFKEKMSRLNQLEAGGSDIGRDTALVQRALLDEGIIATPLCELTEVTDVSWQKAIEGYLGNNVEALFVAPEDAEAAVRIFRKINRSSRLHGAIVINSRKVETWKVKAIKNSCASLVKSDNPIVEAFLFRMLNRLICVNTEKELLAEDIAMTSDGVLHKNGSIKSLRFRRNMMLGKKAKERTIADLKLQISEDGPELEHLKQSKIHTDRIKGSLSVAQNQLGDWQATVILQEDLEVSNEKWEAKSKQLNAINLNHLKEIKTDYESTCKKVSELDEQKIGLTSSIAAMGGAYETNKSYLEEIEKRVDSFADERNVIQDKPDFDQEAAVVKETELTGLFEDDLMIMQTAHERSGRLKVSADKHERTGLNTLRDYRMTYKIEQASDDIATDVLWNDVKVNRKRLEDTELANHEDSARRALKDAEEAFRTDVALKLRENISGMKILIGELNRSLKTRPFSGGETYQFEHSVNSEYRDMIKFVEKSSLDSQANVGSLLDEDRGFTDDLIERNKADKSTIADYRNYYSYDIKITSKSGTTSRLSKRLGVASGGENRTPYYVTIGASMASAYRISNQLDSHDGLGLIPLDEPFEKMDGNNLVQAMTYLKDIGLQMIIAAPDDQQIKLSPMINTVIFLSRDGENLSSRVTYLKDKASELLQSDRIVVEADKIEEATV